MHGFNKLRFPSPEKALKGRRESLSIRNRHAVLLTPLLPPYPAGSETALFGMGCFWGAERCFWTCPGVTTTAVGYSAGVTPNPSYQEVCSGLTGHNEVVLVVFDPRLVPYTQLLKIFWENHDPTQGMRQGNDLGTQYRSGIYTDGKRQMELAAASRAACQKLLTRRGYGQISTEIKPRSAFYFAEDFHQQYLARNPGGYCGLGGTGIELRPDFT